MEKTMNWATWFALDSTVPPFPDVMTFQNTKTAEFNTGYMNDPSQYTEVPTNIVIETVPGPPDGCGATQI